MDGNAVFRIVLIVLAAFVLFALISYYNSKQNVVKAERFYQDTLSSEDNHQNYEHFGPTGSFGATGTSFKSSGVTGPAHITNVSANQVQPAEEHSNSVTRPVDFTVSKLPNDCFPKDRLTADDLLPQDAANSKWAQVNPAGQGDVRDQNFLSAGALIGIDTVGSTLRNASHDLRSTPAAPRGIWPIMNSTIEPDLYRRPLEIA